MFCTGCLPARASEHLRGPELLAVAPEPPTAPDLSPLAPFQCPICFESFTWQSGNVITVPCPRAHRFCRLCLTQHAAAQRFPRCPGEDCRHELSEEELVDICGEDSVTVLSFREELLLKAVFGLGDVVHCPNPCCSSILSVEPGSGRQRVECCNWPAWCTQCRQPYHYAVDCQDVQALRDQWLQWVSHGRAVYNETRAQHAEFERQKQALEEAAARHVELKHDEEWKQANCRECPRCRRVVQKIDGCNSMVCGEDTHGGNRQQGCGHRFQWDKARAYQAAPDSRPLPRLDVQDVKVRGAGIRHPFCRCSRCRQDIVGPRFRCIHCPDYNLCASCDSDAAVAQDHPASHVFQILFQPEYDLRAHLPVGSRIVIADGSERQGFEATVQHEICQDVFLVEVFSDGTFQQLHRSGLQLKLDSAQAIERHIQEQLQAQASLQLRKEERRLQAIREMRQGATCSLQ